MAACGQVPQQPEAERPAAPAASAPEKPPVPPRREPLPDVALTSGILYQALVAEIAGQRGELALSAAAYLDLAKRTRDPRLARRAAEVAFHARDVESALLAARLWERIDPGSPQALQMLTGMLVSANRVDEAEPYVAALLARETDDLGDALVRLNRLFARHPDKRAIQALVDRLTAPYAGIAEAHFARAQAAFNAGSWQHGVAEADQARVLRPDWDEAVLLQAQLLRPEAPERALDVLRAYLEAHPRAREVRMQYARSLVGEKKFQPARAEFETLLRDAPDNPDVVFAVAVLSMQLHDWAVAEANFRKLLDRDYADANSVRLYLGQIAEERKQYAEAMRWYEQVGAGDQFLAARTRMAQVLSKQGKLDEARRQLRAAAAAHPDEQISLLLGEAQLLRDAGRAQEAFDLLETELKARPDQAELLYESALLAERIGRMDLLESRLRTLMRLKPEHAHAYNALGYSLADRNERLEEAQGLIAKALSLSPDDPFILDSMGWVLFRRGDGAGALNHLQRAFAIRADAEIAAHLGEVLWSLGRRDEARKTWRDAMRATPDNEALISVIKRLDP